MKIRATRKVILQYEQTYFLFFWIYLSIFIKLQIYTNIYKNACENSHGKKEEIKS